MGIKNKIKDKVLDVIERMYPNNLEINDNIEPEPERDRYGLTKEDWIGREDDESFEEMLHETYDPEYEFEEYKQNYKALNDVRDDNKLEILTFIRDLEKFKVEILDDLLENKLQEKVKTGLIFSSGYVFKDFDFKTDDFKTNITDEQFKEIYEKEMEYRDNFINFKVYNKDGEEIFDRNTYKNSNVYEKIDNFKEVQDLNSKDFNELRDDYAKNVRSLTRLIEDLEKENQKNKIIPKEKEIEEKEIETEKNNDKEMEF